MKIRFKLLSIMLLSLCIEISNAQLNTLKFERISIEQGLSQSSVKGIYQDNRGFLWIGTAEGLNRFDGFNFEVYKMDKSDSAAISENWITAIYQDKTGTLWIGTDGGGLNKYNNETESFKSYQFSNNNPKSLSNNTINCIFEDTNNELWIGTNNGLNKYNRTTDNFLTIKHNKNQPNSISGNNITAIYETRNGDFWIGTSDDGICKFNRKLNTSVNYKYNQTNKNGISSNTVWAITEDNTNNSVIWIGTKNGLDKFDSKTGVFTHYQNNPENSKSICGNEITALLYDKTGNLWIGTAGTGLSILAFENRLNPEFDNYTYNPSDVFSISKNQISALFEDKSGAIWVGTKGGGINKYQTNHFNHFKKFSSDKGNQLHNSLWCIYEDQSNQLWIGYEYELYCFEKGKHFTKNFKIYSYKPNNLKGINSDHMNSITEDNYGNVWVGTKNGGINIIDKKTGVISYITHQDNNKKSLVNNDIRTLYKDSKGNIWAGTALGLSVITPDATGNKTIVNFTNDSTNTKSLSHNRINAIFEDTKGIIWIGTSGGGLNKLIPDSNNPQDYGKATFKHFIYKQGDNMSINDIYIMSLCEDKSGNFWVGTYDGGLNLMDREKETFVHFTVANGLPNNVIYGILADNANNLWLSTNNGLSKFNTQTNKVKNFDIKDGLQSNEFNRGAYFKGNNGLMYFGGINGLTILDPDKITNNTYKPPVVITSFKIFNKPVLPGADSPLKKSITETQNIELSWRQYLFSFEFAALSYTSSHKNLYAYKMIGLDDDWIYTDGQNRTATYTNLSGGNYVFKVIAANNDGVWNEEGTSINIYIAPPIWKTNWFRILLVILIGGSAYFWYRQRIKRIKHAKDELERLVKIRTAEVEHQKEEIRSQSEQLEKTNVELEKLSIVARETDNAVIITDHDFNVEWINDGFTRFYGYTYDEYTNHAEANLVKNSNYTDIDKITAHCRNTKKSVRFENMITTKIGEKKWVQTTITPITNDLNEIIKFIAIDSDISELKEAEITIKNHNEEILTQNEEIRMQNEEIYAQKEELLFKSDLLNSSIHYAKTIQNAILPNQKLLSAYFENFIIYLPKDIVSGDFYWHAVLPNQELMNQLKLKQISPKHLIPEIHYFAIVDCTGHGVPGAFMSMIGSRLLSEIINERKIYDPNEVLTELNRLIRISLKQDESENKDGMDISLCKIEQTTNTINLTFSGSNTKMFVHSATNNEIKILSGDKIIIGGHKYDVPKKFTNQTKVIEKDDIIYMTTDGIVDQNNLARSRFGSKKLLEKLNEIATLTLPEQKLELEQELALWMQDTDQRDDITFFAFKI